jgi:hypothetical protein
VCDGTIYESDHKSTIPQQYADWDVDMEALSIFLTIFWWNSIGVISAVPGGFAKILILMAHQCFRQYYNRPA